jgi:Reverse transcriptase (RNA-dependent DNA polymerase)
VLSPLLFAIFIDDLVTSVRSANAGCYLSFNSCCKLLYADDILLLSPSITGLQLLLNACEKELDNIDMRINVNISSCIRFSNRFNSPCAEIVSSHGVVIKWSDSCRYLGIHFASGRSPNIVKECQLHFSFLPLGYQITIYTANFLQKFVAAENTVCRLYVDIATVKLRSLF